MLIAHYSLKETFGCFRVMVLLLNIYKNYRKIDSVFCLEMWQQNFFFGQYDYGVIIENIFLFAMFKTCSAHFIKFVCTLKICLFPSLISCTSTCLPNLVSFITKIVSTQHPLTSTCIINASWITCRTASDQEKIFLRAVVAEFQRCGLEEAEFAKIYIQHSALCRIDGKFIVGN